LDELGLDDEAGERERQTDPWAVFSQLEQEEREYRLRHAAEVESSPNPMQRLQARARQLRESAVAVTDGATGLQQSVTSLLPQVCVQQSVTSLLPQVCVQQSVTSLLPQVCVGCRSLGPML
jgi:hypothetical protein